MIFKIDGLDFGKYISALKVGYETLVSDTSGRNASGDMVIDITNRKTKLYATFIPLDGEEMAMLMNTLEGYVLEVQYEDPYKGLTTITTYTNTPEPEYYTKQPTRTLFKPLSVNFIEL